MGLFPIYTYEDGDVLPDKGNYYIIAKNGIFLHKDTGGIINGLVKVDSIPTLAEIEPRISMNLPKIPSEILYQALVFFRRVWHQHRGEAEVNIMYSKAEKQYRLTARPQEVSMGGVNYSPKVNGGEDPVEVQFYSEQRRQGWLRVGTIHSHCNFGAFHSGTDTNDEAHQDGVHITCGHVDRRHFSMVASLVCNDNRFQVDPENVVLGIEPKSDYGSSKYTTWMSSFSSPANYYDFTFTEEEIDALNEELVPYIIKEWMPLVSGRKIYNWWQKDDDRTDAVTVPVSDPSDVCRQTLGIVTNSPAPTTPGLFDGETVNPQPVLVSIMVSIRDDATCRIEEIGKKLTEAGLLETQVMEKIGAIAGKVEMSQLDAGITLTFRKVEGVADLECASLAVGNDLSALHQVWAAEDRQKMLWRVKGAAHGLRSSAVEIPPERRESLLAVLREFLGKDEITDADLEAVANLDVEKKGEKK